MRIFVTPSPASLVAFLLVIGFIIGCVLAGVYFANRKLGRPAAGRTLQVAVGLAAWIGFTSAVVATGALRQAPMPGIPLFFATVLMAALAFGLSPLGRTLALGVPLWTLVAFQAFRLMLELVLHSWAAQGTIPQTMTWTGQNFDIVTGIVALAAAPLAVRSRAAAWVANLVGLALLFNVGRVAMLSSPLPFAWDVDPPLQLVLHLPYAWIGPVCVAGALTGHVILTRALLLPRPTSGESSKNLP